MHYVFMDNFRGFSNTLLPIDQVTFLVGENSTGKSSFLKLLNILSQPQFWLMPFHSFQEEIELSNFEDIVSAWAIDKTYFRTGLVVQRKDKKREVYTCVFTLITFEDRQGSPIVSRYVNYANGRLTKFIFTKKQTQYKIESVAKTFENENAVVEFINKLAINDVDDINGFSFFPNNVPPYPPPPVAMSILQHLEQGKEITDLKFSAEIPHAIDLTWIAPIRTKPQRFYDGARKAFSPEGEHAPFILRRAMRVKSKSVDFANKLKKFGEESGLFEAIIPHAFGKNTQAPFEILIKFAGANLNINNVGYGVSQVLPLLVEFLTGSKNQTFAVQQPEVHLHPRAQAALGDLIAQLVVDEKHKFILETHSDYLIDRFRLNISKRQEQIGALVIFFERTNTGNKTTVLRIGPDGKYPFDQPPEFRDFFIREEMNLLEV